MKDAASKSALRNSFRNYQNCVLVFKDASSNYLIVRWSRLEGRQAHNLDFGLESHAHRGRKRLAHRARDGSPP